MKMPGLPQTGTGQAILANRQQQLQQKQLREEAKGRRQGLYLDAARMGLGTGNSLYQGWRDRTMQESEGAKDRAGRSILQSEALRHDKEMIPLRTQAMIEGFKGVLPYKLEEAKGLSDIDVGANKELTTHASTTRMGELEPTLATEDKYRAIAESRKATEERSLAEFMAKLGLSTMAQETPIRAAAASALQEALDPWNAIAATREADMRERIMKGQASLDKDLMRYRYQKERPQTQAEIDRIKADTEESRQRISGGASGYDPDVMKSYGEKTGASVAEGLSQGLLDAEAEKMLMREARQAGPAAEGPLAFDFMNKFEAVKGDDAGRLAPRAMFESLKDPNGLTETLSNLLSQNPNAAWEDDIARLLVPRFRAGSGGSLNSLDDVVAQFPEILAKERYPERAAQGKFDIPPSDIEAIKFLEIMKRLSELSKQQGPLTAPRQHSKDWLPGLQKSLEDNWAEIRRKQRLEAPPALHIMP